MEFILVSLLGLLVTQVSSDDNQNETEMVVNIDGQVIRLVRRDKVHLTFDPSNVTSDDDDEEVEKTDKPNDADRMDPRTVLLRRMIRRAKDEYDISRVVCLENLARFRALAQNRPLQVVVMVEEGQEARLTCHFCEESDRVQENRKFDAIEQAEGRPLWRDEESIRSPILWYRISHRGSSRGFRLTEVRPNLHDDDESNSIYVTAAHTLVIAKASVDDARTYFCRDTRTTDHLVKEIILASEIAEMMGDSGEFRFLLHLDDDAGTYFCRDTRKADHHAKEIILASEIAEMMGDSEEFRFLLHLDVLRTIDIPVRDVTPLRVFSAPRVKNRARNIELFTSWSEWGACSTCDQPGEQRKRGVCTVKKLEMNKDSQPWYINAVLNAQAEGVPCRSSLFHTEFEDVRSNTEFIRPDEVMIRSCKKVCGGAKAGAGFLKNLLPKKMVSATALKKLFKKEEKEKKVIKIINETEGATIRLKCPGVTLDDTVMWMNKSRYIPGVNLPNATGGRASVDVNGTLHISPVVYADRGLYLCIVGGKEKGHVFLKVTKIPPEDDFYKYRMWVLYSFPADFTVFLFLMIVKHRFRKQILISSEDVDLSSSGSSEDNFTRNNPTTSSITSLNDCNSSVTLSTRSSDCSCNNSGSHLGLLSQTSI